MKNPAGAFQAGRREIHVGDIPLAHVKAVAAVMLSEVLGAPAGKIVENPHLAPGDDKRIDEMTADKSGAAGHDVQGFIR